MNVEYKIEVLNKEDWKGYILPIAYTSKEAYRMKITKKVNDSQFEIIKTKLDKEIKSSPEDHDFSDCLFQDHWDNPQAFGVIVNTKLVAAIEVTEENWNNRLRITELWVHDDYQRQGIGKRLVETCVKLAIKTKRRAIVLETQSSNTKAIDFYFKNNFEIIGFDTIHYSNDDLKKDTYRLEMGRML